MNDFQRHKKSDKIKWVITGVAFILVFALIVGLCLQLFGNGKQKPSEWFAPATEYSEENGGAEITESESHGISLSAEVIMPVDYEAYGIMPIADTAYTITATVTPAEATFQEVDFSLSFKNPSSTWAIGKNVSDYATFVADSDGAKTGKLTVKQAFGEQLELKCTTRDPNSTASATCTIDYAKEITNTGIVVEVGSRSWEESETLFDFSSATSANISYSSGYDGEYISVNLRSPAYGIGTVNDTISERKLTISVNSKILSAVNSALGVSCVPYVINVDDSDNGDMRMSNIMAKVFGSDLTKTSAGKNKLWSLQTYYTNKEQSLFTVTYSFKQAKRGEKSFDYSLFCDFTGCYTKVSGVGLNSSNLTV